MALKIRHANKSKNIPWHHKVRQYVKKCIKTSTSVSCCPQVPWRQNVCHDINKCNIRHSAKTFVTSTICHVINKKSWCYKVRHDVNTRHDDKRFCHDFNKFDMMSKQTMTSKSSLCHQKVRHDVKTCYDDKCSSLLQNIHHGTSWRQKVCHDVKNVSWSH